MNILVLLHWQPYHALRSGVDLSIIACPKSVASPIRSYSPDLIVKSLSDNYINLMILQKYWNYQKKQIQWLLGCGIGREEETGLALNEMIEKITNAN